MSAIHRHLSIPKAEILQPSPDASDGNMSDNEHWRTPAGDLKNSLSMLNAECCVAYNMMKLERTAFLRSGDARWMDAYERSLFNCRLGTQNDQGWKQYFFPLQGGGYRAFHSPDESFWCCTGTGAEDFAKFTDSIYFHSGDDLYINQFIPSELNWKESGLVLRQKTTFPSQQGTSIEIVSGPPKLRSIYLRIPAWTGHGVRSPSTAKPWSFSWNLAHTLSCAEPGNLET